MEKKLSVGVQAGSIVISQVCHRLVFPANQTAFLGRDNVLEVALGLIIGAAFSTLVSSLVTDVILTPITLLSPNSGNLAPNRLARRVES